MDGVKICEGLSDLSDSYSGFLIDQWGTLHDGEKPFEGVIEALENLKSRGKQIILISNSGQRAIKNAERLHKMSITPNLYNHVVTSAEMTWRSLNNRDEGVFKGLGNKCFLMNRAGDQSVLKDTDITVTDNVTESDFILLTGSDAPTKTLENYYDDILRQASRRQIKMICANPEMTIIIQGQHILGSGQIARRYEEFGGVVSYIGKPFPSIFQYATSLFEDLLPSQIAMIGDSLSHDMRGATAMNMDCVLIASGTHNGTFSRVKTTADIHKLLKTLGVNYGVTPTCFVPRFAWGKALPDRKNRRRAK